MGTEGRYKFSSVTLLAGFAVGVPGKRTFFLGIGDKNSWVRIWLEKEHLQALNIAVEQLLSTLSEEKIYIPSKAEPPMSDDTPRSLPAAELDIVQMALGYEEGKVSLKILVQRSGAHEPDTLEVHGRFTLAQLKKLANQSASVCAAGRPLCPICGEPVDIEGHVCPGQN
jgi:uncharacterized repeat protein (TIGR03847 family)